MTPAVPTVNLAPAAQLLLVGALAAALVLAVLAWRQRGRGAKAWLAALTTLTAVLTFDLIVFGSFTRLTDSGLGCPDWPGCYGSASPWGAASDIAKAQAAMPTGPVTFTKAWIEMIHRYLAMTVGALILVMTIVAWIRRRELPQSPWWPTVSLIWVLVQGLFGKFTVTLKLYPAIVTLHLLGGMLLLTLLIVQHLQWRPRPLSLRTGTRQLLLAVTATLWIQIALGGWVSTNYAVLACSGFPTCNDQWWPAMKLAEGFELLRPLGERGSGALLSFEALVGIHMMHRLFAFLVLGLLLGLAWRLWQERSMLGGGKPAGLVAGLALWQLASGLSNVVLGWPLGAALAHSAGAAALVAATTALCVRSSRTGATVRTDENAQLRATVQHRAA